MRYYLLTIFFLYASIINSQNSGDYPLEIPIILSGMTYNAYNFNRMNEFYIFLALTFLSIFLALNLLGVL